MKRGVRPGYKWPDSQRWHGQSRVHDWPGPFKVRKDASTPRPAVWLSCAYCGVLFMRSVTEAHHSHGRNGELPNISVCSLSCGSASRRDNTPRYRVCSVCGRVFLVPRHTNRWPVHKKRQTCSAECKSQAHSEQRLAKTNIPLQIYAYERGIEANYWMLTCDLCGREQSRDGASKKTWWAVRVTVVNNVFVARCKGCYAKDYSTRLKAQTGMTLGQKMRWVEAQKLIQKFLDKQRQGET